MSTDIAAFMASRHQSPVPPDEPRNAILHGDCLTILPQVGISPANGSA